ncbi:MAG: nicotinate-nucleotide--dimethylbenzimidazole phosphoribosyltransferase, partial [Myxococcota bacterium]
MSGEHRNERQSLDTVERVARAVEPTAAVWLARAHSRHDQLTKPPGSLGRLEALGARLCAIQKTLSPTVERCRVVVFAGDHGVAAAHAVSPYPCAVTAQMVGNFAAGGAAINALAGAIGVEVEVIDIGVASPLPAVAQASADAAPDPSGRARVIHARVAAGTADFAATPAMTHSQLAAALA